MSGRVNINDFISLIELVRSSGTSFNSDFALACVCSVRSQPNLAGPGRSGKLSSLHRYTS